MTRKKDLRAALSKKVRRSLGAIKGAMLKLGREMNVKESDHA